MYRLAYDAESFRPKRKLDHNRRCNCYETRGLQAQPCGYFYKLSLGTTGQSVAKPTFKFFSPQQHGPDRETTGSQAGPMEKST